jgi:hypothetical protein
MPVDTIGAFSAGECLLPLRGILGSTPLEEQKLR